jgi:hypothetical protein
VVVERLTERGRVLRATSHDDARRTTLRLASAGKRLLASAPRSPQADLLEALAQLSAAERKELERLLERVVRGMGIDDSTPPPMLFEGEGPVTRRRPRTRVARRRALGRG